MKTIKYKVKADIGDGEGGGFYHIGSFSSMALALIFINSLKAFFGIEMKYLNDVLGVPIDYIDDGAIFKGLKLTDENNKEMTTFY